MALRAQVINLIRLNMFQDTAQTRSVRQIPVMQFQAQMAVMGVLIDMVDPLRRESGRPAHNAMDLISLLQQKFRQIRTILTGNPCNQRLLHSKHLAG